MKGIALTDHGNMFGIKEFFNYVNKKNSGKSDEEKFKPILGCEMYVAKNDLHDRGDKHDNGYHLIVLAKNQTGYHNLVKLVSKAWTEGYYFKPRTDHKELQAHSEGLIVCSACLGGEVPQHFMNGELEKAEETILWYKSVFGEDYYLELQRHKTDKPDGNRRVFEEQERVNPFIVEMSRKHGIKLIATNDSHFVDEEDAEAHDRLICISMMKRFADPARLHYTKQEWIKSQEEMQSIFSDFPEALANTGEILDKVEFYSIDHAPIMPNFEIPAEFGTEAEYRQRLTEEDLFNEFTRDENGNVVLSQEDAEKKIKKLGGYDKLYRIKFEADYLNKLTIEGAKKKYGDPLPKDVEERLRFELHIMKTMGFPGYFLIVQDFINAARHDLGVSVGPGRGSAAGSAAAYCLGITQIDPIKYDLLFERFLNPDRISLPDIDVDFDDDGRYEVLKYVTRKYGAEKVAHIITYGTMATKMAIKDVAKIMELPLPEANRLARLVPDRMPEGKVNFDNCLKYIKEFAAEAQSPNPVIREVMKYARQLEGNVRNTGVHACGVIIGRDDITDWVPVSTAKDTDGSSLLVTQYEGSVIEDTGMIKMDFLGLKTLSIIMEAVANIKQSRGIDLDMETIPLDDKKTYRLYCEGRTTGTFQFESAGMQKYLRELQPSKFEDLIAMNALYRPGPMDYIPSFIARKHGREPITYDIPVMKQYLEETYGITVYQEQVMLLSRLLANFTRGESDMLRKAMGKKQIDKMAKLKVKFMAEGQKNGHKGEVLEKIWADWEKFASYAFNKSHATCYTWVAYQTAYLKANYPAEFMAGVMSRNLSASDKISKVMDECKRMGLKVKGPDINESGAKFGVNKMGEIRFGLSAVKSVGDSAVSAIIKERKANGPYKDIYDFVERVNLSACNRGSIESLALAGAFDCFGISREMIVAPLFDSTYAEQLVRYGQNVQNDKCSLQASLFDDLEPIETNKPPYPDFEPWSRLKLLEAEKNYVTMYLSAHPLDPYYMELTYGCNTTCDEFEEKQVDGAQIVIGGMITAVEEKYSKKGNAFGLITLEDFNGKAQFRLFGKQYDAYRNRFVAGDAVMIHFDCQAGRFNPSFLDMNIVEVTDLAQKRGSVANGVMVILRDDRDYSALYKDIVSFQCDDKTQRLGQLYFRIFNMERKQYVQLHSRKKYRLDKDFIDMLEANGVNFKVHTVRD